MVSGSNNLMPVVSKIFCSPSQTTLIVRKRPRLVNGGGFAVLNSDQNVVLSVHGGGILGVNGELILKDCDGASTLFIRKQGGLVQALSACDLWKGYLMEFGRPSTSVFSLRDPRSCFAMKKAIRISIERKGYNKDWVFEVTGSFLEKCCTIKDRRGSVVAKVGVKGVNASEDFYNVAVQPGYDQAFVVGVRQYTWRVHKLLMEETINAMEIEEGFVHVDTS